MPGKERKEGKESNPQASGCKYPALTGDLFSKSAHTVKNKRSKSPAGGVESFAAQKKTQLVRVCSKSREKKAGFVTKIISWELFTVSYSGYWQSRKFSLKINNQMWELGKTVLS